MNEGLWLFDPQHSTASFLKYILFGPHDFNHLAKQGSRPPKSMKSSSKSVRRPIIIPHFDPLGSFVSPPCKLELSGRKKLEAHPANSATRGT